MSAGDDWRTPSLSTPLRWAQYDHEQRQVAARPRHDCRFSGGPHDGRTERFPSMPPPEPVEPPRYVEIGHDFGTTTQRQRPPDAGPEWVSPTYVRQGRYVRASVEGHDLSRGTDGAPRRGADERVWHYEWEAGS